MLKRRLIWLIILAFVVCGVSLQAQEKAAPAGPEKVMIFNGEQIKVQLYGSIRLDGIYNEKNVINEISPLFVNNTKFTTPQVTAGGTSTFPAVSSRPFYTGVLVQGTANNNPFALSPARKPIAMFNELPPAFNSGSTLFSVSFTKLGLNLTGPKALGADTSGKLEIDFWGNTPSGGNASRNYMPRIRNGYLDIAWNADAWGVNIRGGQDNSLVMPIYAAPLTNDPLLYFEKGFVFNWDIGAVLGIRLGTAQYNVLIEGAIARSQAGNDTPTLSATTGVNFYAATSVAPTAVNVPALYPGVSGTQVEERGAGEASKRPGWRGRVTVKIAPSKLFNMYLGFTGHYQIEKQGMMWQNLLGSWKGGSGIYNFAAVTALNPGIRRQAILAQKVGKEVPSQSIGAFARLTIAVVSFVGAGYYGWNMDAFVAGLGQGAVESFSGLKMVAVPVKGGYAQVQIYLAPIGIPITLAAGIGKVQKTNNKLISIGQILNNRQVQGMITFHLNQYLLWSWEVSSLETKYKGRYGSDSNMAYRSQLSFNF